MVDLLALDVAVAHLSLQDRNGARAEHLPCAVAVHGGGEVFIVTPHYTDFSSFCDPTHRWHLNSFSMRYFGQDHGGFGYYSTVRFEENSVRVKLLALWRWLGFEWLVNTFPRFRKFWEHYLCYVVRGKVIEWRLKVLKT